MPEIYICVMRHAGNSSIQKAFHKTRTFTKSALMIMISFKIFRFFLSAYTRFFYKQHFYKQRQAEIGKTLSKSLATPWDWTFAIWKLFALFIHAINQK